ncbi:EAL domain-containing protein [Roseibium denhamense]|nr:EAL domain-containing protein [Roseibium denhamense]
MQVSQRLDSSRREASGYEDSITLTAFHSSLLEVLPHAAAYVGRDGNILVHNKLLKSMCRSNDMSPVPVSLQSLMDDASWKRCGKALSASFNGVPSQITGAIYLKSGQLLCTHLLCTSFVSFSNGHRAVLIQFETDAVEPKAVDEQPQDSRRDFGLRDLNQLLAGFPDEVVILEPDDTLEQRAAKLVTAARSAYDVSLVTEALRDLPAGSTQTLYLPERQGKDSSAFPVDRRMCEIRLAPLPQTGSGRDQDAPMMAILRRNVDCPYEVAENRRLAYQDPLTGLANRRSLTRALDQELQRLRLEPESGLAIIYIDLDEFKKVNDLGGHDAGDDMLLRVAACLTLTLGEFGTAARIGGDEFAGMLPVASKEAAHEIAERILDGFDRIRLEIADRVFTIGGSIGVAYLAPGISLDDTDPASLLAIADRACLRGKRFGGRSVQVHSVVSGDCAANEMALRDLPEPGSFRANELALYSMPIVCLRRQQFCGSEILLRLQGERAEGLSSRAWISAAERSGFIAQVDAWTLDKVLDVAERSPVRSLLTMNVSAESARDPNFRDCLFNRLSPNPLLASKLCLEIAEKDFLREPVTVENFFQFVSDLGCQTAIDDFAGHWPVLSRLTALRVDWLKLEASLTQQVVEAPAKTAILSGLVRAAHELGIKVIAKHVETAAEASLLKELNVEAAQGFYFGRPEPWPEAS